MAELPAWLWYVTRGEVIKLGDFMMADSAGFNWIRIVAAIILAELLPILLLVLAVFVYSVRRTLDDR